MDKSISKTTSEFSKLDRIDRLVCLNLIENRKSWNEIASFINYLRADYFKRAILIQESMLLDELKQFEAYSAKMQIE
jgi:hypothetical protein